MLRHPPAATILVIAAVLFPLSVPATEWSVDSGRITLSLNESHLRDLGLTVVSAPQSVPPGNASELVLEPPLYAFETAPGVDLRVRTERGLVEGFEGAPIPFVGGLLLRTEDPVTGAPRSPLALLDFTLEIDADTPRNAARFLVADPAVQAPLAIVSSGFALDRQRRELRLRVGDLVITREWATALGAPHLDGQLVGGVDVHLRLRSDGPFPTDELAAEPDRRPEETGSGILDVKLGELFGVTSAGRVGTYPNGVSGLTAATTSCNNGDTNVPWNAPMTETHPFIGLAFFREQNGVLEQLSRNWIKHGWFALPTDLCNLGCVGGGGTYLAVGCSDTYDAFNNAERFFLGPREEVNPHTATWTACGSYFDATPTDCLRDYFGTGHDAVEHRLEVHDGDLGIPGAAYYYEGAYYVADDDTVSNNIGWRECTTTWNGSTWSFSTLPSDTIFAANPGPVISSWGDMQSSGGVAVDDGLAWLAVKTTDLGGGQWHYEYAVYNRTSDRGMYSFSVPVGSATVTNVGFRDIDDSVSTDWSSQVADGRVTWFTDDHATNPSAPALTYQTMFNFRFDADAAPVTSQGRGLLFEPGIGTDFYLDTLAPAPGATAVAQTLPEAGPGIDGLFLGAGEPNPFSRVTRIRFARPTAGSARLSVLDISGRVVRVLAEGRVPAGESSVEWNGRDAGGTPVASGIYFFRLETENDVRTTKVTLLR